MKQIKLTQDKVTIVDDKDYEVMNKYKWHYNKGYARRRYKSSYVYMHREIISVPDGLVSDHINRDKLDNRRSNLRAVTRTVNNINKDFRNGTSSQYRGVTWNKSCNLWQSQIMVNSEKKYLGCFKSEIEAAKVYNKAARKYHKEFAVLNRVGDE